MNNHVFSVGGDMDVGLETVAAGRISGLEGRKGILILLGLSSAVSQHPRLGRKRSHAKQRSSYKGQ